MKQQEKELLEAVIQNRQLPHRQWITVDDIGEKLGIPSKRVYYFVCKWDKFWEYGVSWRTGWFYNINKAKEYLKDPDAERRKI